MKRRIAAISAALLALVAAPPRRAVSGTADDTPPHQPAFARFHFGGNVAEIPARFVGQLVFVPVRVNQSQPSLFQLDSTAAVSAIDRGRATELGLASLQSPALNLSGVDFLLGSLAAVGKNGFGAQVGRPYEGTLGNDFFAGAVIEINYARQTMRLYDPAAFQYSGRGKAVKLTVTGGLPVLHAKFSMASGKSFDGEFLVNTALDDSVVISRKYAEPRKLLAHVRTVPCVDCQLAAAGLAESGAVNARIRTFEIGPYSIPEAIGVFPRGDSLADRDARLAGEIGGGLLRRFIVTFDFPRQQIFFDSSSEFRADEIEDMSGIAVFAGGPDLKTFEVAQVFPGTPGADAKIQKGDIIAGINDEAAADMSLAEIRRLFHQPASKYKILIERGSQTLTVNLQTRHLLWPSL